MAENIRKTPLGGLLRRGATGDVPPEMSAVDQLRRYQESIAAPPKPLISPAASYIQQVARERAASPVQTPVVGFGDRAMSASQDEILRQAELKAIADIATPRLLDETSPARVTNFALRTGNEAGDNNRERSFLERMAQSGLLSTLQGMARAERQYGVGPLAAFSESNLDVQAARDAAEQEAAKRQSEGADRQAKILAEQIKKSGFTEFKGPMIKSIEKATATKQSLDAINTYLELLSNKRIGGVGAKLEEGVNAIGALFGAGGESGAATARSIRSQIITGLQMGVSQGQISQGDYDQLNNILSGDGWFVSNEKVESQLQRLKGVLGGKLSTTTKILEAQGVDPSRFSPNAPSGLVSARRTAQ